MVYISLTTISKRLFLLQYVLKSLFEQTYVADKIFLNISKDAYGSDEGICCVPAWLDNEITKGIIELKYVENTGPYRKLMPIIETINDTDLVVICDDDVIYEATWLETMVNIAELNKDSVICSVARKVTKVPLIHRYKGYNSWPLLQSGIYNTDDALPIGAGGVLYRKVFFQKDLLSRDFKRLAPFQDDIFFWSALSSTSIVVLGNKEATLVFPIIDGMGLHEKNLSTGAFLEKWNIFSKIFYFFLSHIGFGFTANDRAIKNLNI